MKHNAAFVTPALVAAFIVAKGKAALRDRHAFLTADLVVIGLLPAAFILFKIGARNLQSVSGIQGVPPLGSLDCWLFYIKSLPGQLGDLTVCLVVGGLAVIMWRFVRVQDRWLHGLLLSWLTVGYLAFTLISLKETHHTIMVLMPLAMARFNAVINGPDYQKTAHFGRTGDLSTGDGTQGIDILRPTYEVVASARRLNIEMPISGQHFEGSIRP
jgi:hypothetical protein